MLSTANVRLCVTIGLLHCALVDGVAFPLRCAARGVGTGVGVAVLRRDAAAALSALSASVPPCAWPGSLVMMLTGGIEAAEGNSTLTDDVAGVTGDGLSTIALAVAAGCCAGAAATAGAWAGAGLRGDIHVPT